MTPVDEPATDQGGQGRADDDRGAGRARPQPQEHLGRDPARPPHRGDRAVRIRQVQPGLRHDLRRRPAPLHGIALELREAIRRPGDQAGRGLRVRSVAGDFDRAEDADQQPALDRRDDDRHGELSESAVRHHRRSRTVRAPASRRRADRRARFSKRSCRCRPAPRSSCARRCSRSTARISTSSSPSFARRAAGG